jgi:hypothetical protein
MKPSISAFICLFFLFVGQAAGVSQNSGGSAPAQEANSTAIQLAPIKHPRKGVDTWPLIANPTSPAEQRVNAILTRLNQRLVSAFQDCDANIRESMKETGQSANGHDPAADDWSRIVVVTMAGPRFLSLVATDETDCGGAHPDSDTMAMVFDMTTGGPVNWVRLLPKSAAPSALTDSVSDGSTMGALVLPALQRINRAAANADCKDAFLDPQGFQLWPDAKHETLVAQPFDLPHVVQACANEINLTLDQARKLGFDESLLTAIQEAHSRVSAASKH